MHFLCLTDTVSPILAAFLPVRICFFELIFLKARKNTGMMQM